jgi:hypothetical protein
MHHSIICYILDTSIYSSIEDYILIWHLLQRGIKYNLSEECFLSKLLPIYLSSMNISTEALILRHPTCLLWASHITRKRVQVIFGIDYATRRTH